MNHPSRRRAVAAVAALAATALVLSGCSRGNADDDTDSAGNDQRVAALGLGDTDTLLALGITPVAVAPWGAKGDVDSPGVGPWAQDKLGDAEPKPIYDTSKGFTADIVEQVAAADPTKIIAVNNKMDKQARSDLEKIAPVTVHPSKYEDWQVPWQTQVETIADAVDKHDEGKKLVQQSEQKIEHFRDEHPDLQGQKAAVVMPYAGKLGLYTEGDGRGDMIDNLGFTIPDDLQNTSGGNFYRDISPENYDELDGLDQLFVLDYNGAIDQLKDDSVFQNLDVVEQGNVHYLNEDVGNAMSMPNPLTIPYAVDAIDTEF